MVIVINKPLGKTPLEAVEDFRIKNPEYRDEKIAYAGRLDPMAHGALILLIGNETKNRKKYEALDKTYIFEVLFGLSTDTYDTLGIVDAHTNQISDINSGEIKKYLENLVGKHNQFYPPYSSKPVNGKPLFYWARMGMIDKIELPSKMIEVYSAKLIDIKNINVHSLKKEIFRRIDLVNGDFRQGKIKNSWEDFFTQINVKAFQTFTIKIKCSSGTYVRSLANEMGKNFGTHAIALNIERVWEG